MLANISNTIRQITDAPLKPVTHLFDGHEVSQAYAKYRFVIAQSVLERVKSYYGQCLDAERCECIVDVGCGPGNNTVAVWRAFSTTSLVHTDTRRVPIGTDHRRRRERIGHSIRQQTTPECAQCAVLVLLRIYPSIHHTCSNANVNVDGLPFADASVDVVISITAVHWMNIPNVMREVQRVLRPGGVLALTSSR
jgi:ubiquinone/menaquinone biosynthesis C-methylase UbiE